MIKKIEELMKRHDVWGLTAWGAGSASVALKNGKYVLETDGLPQLTFFVELAKLLGVDLESIKTESNDLGPGCETCGYGGGTEFLIFVPAVPTTEL